MRSLTSSLTNIAKSRASLATAVKRVKYTVLSFLCHCLSVSDRAKRAPRLLLLILFFAEYSYASELKRIVVMPKLVGIDYYDAVKVGVDAAAKELPHLEVQWLGPTKELVEEQINLLESNLSPKPDLVAVAANDPVIMGGFLKSAVWHRNTRNELGW